MKLSDYVVSFIEKEVADSIFLLSGGGIMHLVDSVGRAKKLKSYCTHHEQAAAIAAEGYARIKNDLGVVLVTTGPGGTNAITGAAGAWLDSIPMLVISGQVKTDNITPRKNGVPVVRAIGFQELNVIDIVKPITKYAVTVEEPHEIRYHLEKAVHLAKSGRPGPVWIEIPLDIQAADVDPKTLPSFIPRPDDMFAQPKIPMELIIKKLQEAKRPMLLAGNGIRLAGGEEMLQKVLKKLKINTATVIFTADDLVTYDYPYYLGRQGMWGNKPANYAIDNCDVLLVIGDRLQLTQLSYDYQNFATQAFKIMVDIDEAELTKKTLAIDLPVHADAKVFLEELYKQDLTLNRWDIDVPQINPKEYQGKAKYLNVYDFHAALSEYSKKGLHVATADGQASVSPHQALRIVNGQRFITNAGLGHMGSGLPLAIGACIANNKNPVLCMDGDGSIMLNIQELQTILYHKLPIKIFLFNNDGYFSIRNTHKKNFNKIVAADSQSGVSFPNFEKITKAWGLAYEKIANKSDLKKLKKVMNYDGSVICELMIDPYQPMFEVWAAGKLRDKKIS